LLLLVVVVVAMMAAGQSITKMPRGSKDKASAVDVLLRT
jgi:hypothetical protein